jgi:hypothetical protein
MFSVVVAVAFVLLLASWVDEVRTGSGSDLIRRTEA